MAVNKYEDCLEQLENRIKSLKDPINMELARPKTVLENKANGLYNNHLDKDVKFLSEEISLKNNIIKTLIENISQIKNYFYKHSYSQNVKQNVNVETLADFVFQKLKKNKCFKSVNRLSQ